MCCAPLWLPKMRLICDALCKLLAPLSPSMHSQRGGGGASETNAAPGLGASVRSCGAGRGEVSTPATQPPQTPPGRP